jgi:cell shape-determining protein MreC
MQFGFSLSKKRVLVAMMGIAILTSFLGGMVSDLLRMPAVCALAPVSDFVKASTSAFKSAIADREEPAMSAAEAVKLRKEVEQWKSVAWARARGERDWHVRYRRIQKTREAFRKSNSYRATLENTELIPARVILGDALPYGQSQTLNQGTIHGIEKGMRVVDVLTDRSKALPAGDRMRAITGYSPVSGKPISGSVLVGWVEAAGSFTARVRLVTDKRFKSDAFLQRMINRAKPRKVTTDTPDGQIDTNLTARNNKLIRVQLSGDGERGLITGAIKKAHNVLPGDWLWTTGGSAKLPVRLRIGVVTSIEPSEGNPNHVIVKAKPAADLGTLRDIFIVRSLVSQLTPQRGGK